MIDFRYHIVSIVAVFLALGLGILMGTTLLDRPLTDEFQRQVNRLSAELTGAQKSISELDAEATRARRLLEQVSPWVTRGRLQQQRVLLVFDGETGGWRDDVRTQLLDSGATVVGSIRLTEKWKLDVEGARDELVLLMQSVTPAFDPGQDPARAALDLLGRRLLEPTGRTLIERLEQGGFLVADSAVEGAQWPPPGTAVVALASEHAAGEGSARWLAGLVRGAAAITPSLAVSAEPQDMDAVRVLRDADGLPLTLATFDSAAADPTGAGSVLALEAAIARRGGHFGAAQGLPFLPEAPAVTPAPSPAG